MLFNSYEFVVVFMPVTLGLYLLASLYGRQGAISVLLIASIAFYGYWSPVYSLLLISSIIVNYLISLALWHNERWGNAWLWVGVAGNLAVIGWFKYAFFLHGNFFWYFGDTAFFAKIILPLGISFFTFQQIAYLIDVRRDRVRPPSIMEYALFVSFFPQLIAGPIVLFQDVARQLQARRRLGCLDKIRFQTGLTLFSIGIFKKVVVADSMSPFSRAVFDHAARDESAIGAVDAWMGALAYSLQLYFDFSGYSDMAIGLARIFGIRIPKNFNSPYKATSIIDFWRRWHMTLTAFFRRYVYIPLGGNRGGKYRQIFNISIVFLLTGIWHGAGWTFILWGIGHGFLVTVNHVWNAKHRAFCARLGRPNLPPLIGRWLNWGVTMLSVILLWVVFRASDVPTAEKMLVAMLGGGSFNASIALASIGFATRVDYIILAMLFVGLFLFTALSPNSSGLTAALWRFSRRVPTNTSGGYFDFGRALLPGIFIGSALYMALATLSKVQSEFLYFQF